MIRDPEVQLQASRRKGAIGEHQNSVLTGELP